MRKLLIILTMIVSSFFFYSSNAFAATYNFTINESDIDFINDDFFTIRNLALDYVKENGGYYVIWITSDNIYYVHFFSSFSDKYYYILNKSFRTWVTTDSSFRYELKNNELTSKISETNSSTASSFDSNNVLEQYVFLDSNLDFYAKTTDLIIFLSYKDNIYSLNDSTPLLSLYDIYLDINGGGEVPDIHTEEKEILSNFYILVIDKINYLATIIINNYIYLSVIGVFIFIFVIELVFRRLL